MGWVLADPSAGAVLAEHVAAVGELALFQDQEAVRAEELILRLCVDFFTGHRQLGAADGAHLGSLVDDKRLGFLIVREHVELFGFEIIQRLVVGAFSIVVVAVIGRGFIVLVVFYVFVEKVFDVFVLVEFQLFGIVGRLVEIERLVDI